MSTKKYLEDYNRLIGKSFKWLYAESADRDPVEPANPGSLGGAKYDANGISNLIPMKNKVKEAQAALEDALEDCNEGKADDAKAALQRARAAIDQALGGIINPAGMGGRG